MKRWLILLAVLAGCHHGGQTYTPRQIIESKPDLLGEAALKQPVGPSYQYFEKLLPPLRYVDADFQRYPIVLSAPGSLVKGRLVSDGSAINARARQPNWNHEDGTPVQVLIGARRVPFGSDLAHLNGPHYVDGYLPIVRLTYDHEGETYGEEAFASVDPALAGRGAILVRFELPAADRGRIELRFADGYDVFKFDPQQHTVRDSSGTLLAQLDDNWEFQPARSAFFNKEKHPPTMLAVIFTAGGGQPTTRAAGVGMAPELEATGRVDSLTSGPSSRPAEAGPPGAGMRSPAITRADIAALNVDVYHQQRELATQRWNAILAAGTQVNVPEPIVNNAWRALLIAQHAIRAGDQLNYSAGNQYARQYSNESGDTMRSLLLWGYTENAARAFKPLFVYRRPGIELHDAAFKLEDLADYYFVTRDANLIRDLRPLWQREIDLILTSRQPDGLLPREAYCSDIRQPVRSVNTNANCWRGLRDMSLVLEEIGEHDQAAKLSAICTEYRKIILAALGKAIDRSVDPPFVRIALDGEEPLSNPITSTRYGSYWNLVVPCVLWSGIFPIDSEPANDIIRYIRENGGLCMGLTRVQSPRGVWMDVHNIDDLYVIRYSNALLKRDEPDRALVTFYGKLAQGFTRETFIDGESTGIEPLDRFGRQIGLPPNSTANASFLLQLRNLLVQDQDMDDDGMAETLRLAFATPRRWLEDGKTISIDRAPTAFGNVSFVIASHLHAHFVTAVVDLPQRQPPQRTLLRLRLPDGHRIVNVNMGRLLDDKETIDLTGLRGRVGVVAFVS